MHDSMYRDRRTERKLVLMYLETMRAAEGAEGETILSPKSRLSALPRSQLSGASFQRNGRAQYAEEDAEDVASDVQEQSQSTLGSLVVCYVTQQQFTH